MSTTQWNKFERIWIISFTSIILATSIFFSATGTDYTNIQSIILNWVISPISALTGIISAVLTAKGKISNYIWGFVNTVAYAYIAYMSGYYGDMLIYILWNAPMRIVGFLAWKKRLKQNSKTDVKIKKMTLNQIIPTIVLTAAGIVLFGIALDRVDNWFINIMQRNQSIYQYLDNVFGVKYVGAIIDSSTVIFQIVGNILMALAFTEQWVIWIIANIVTSAMWTIVIIADRSSIPWALPTLIMWVAYLINSIYGYSNWRKAAKTDA